MRVCGEKEAEPRGGEPASGSQDGAEPAMGGKGFLGPQDPHIQLGVSAGPWEKRASM